MEIDENAVASPEPVRVTTGRLFAFRWRPQQRGYPINVGFTPAFCSENAQVEIRHVFPAIAGGLFQGILAAKAMEVWNNGGRRRPQFRRPGTDHAMKLTIGQRVRIKDDAFEFGGIVGTIDLPPAGIHSIDSNWIGPFKYRKQRKGMVLVYWVTFDEPADDGSGDGPYRGAEIEESDLQPIGPDS